MQSHFGWFQMSIVCTLLLTNITCFTNTISVHGSDRILFGINYDYHWKLMSPSLSTMSYRFVAVEMSYAFDVAIGLVWFSTFQQDSDVGLMQMMLSTSKFHDGNIGGRTMDAFEFQNC